MSVSLQKERPLLGRLENRESERERVVFVWMLVLHLE
jgi:hypothetical protein